MSAVFILSDFDLTGEMPRRGIQLDARLPQQTKTLNPPSARVLHTIFDSFEAEFAALHEKFVFNLL